MELTYEQIMNLKGKLVEGSNHSPYSKKPFCSFVGILTQDDHSPIIWHLSYRYIKDGEVKGHKFSDSLFIYDSSKQKVSSYSLTALGESSPLRRSWNEAERRESLRKEGTKELLKPFENVLEKVESSDFLSLVPEMPLGSNKKFILGRRIVLSRMMFWALYNIGSQGYLDFLGLDTLVGIENFVKEEASNQGLSFRHSRLTTQGNCLKHEFFFD